MARRLSYSARYPYPAEQVYAAQSTPRYWDEMMAGFEMFSPKCEVVDFACDDSGLKVVLRQTIGRDQLPSLAQTVPEGHDHHPRGIAGDLRPRRHQG